MTTEHNANIVVNGTPKSVPKGKLSYADVVQLATGAPPASGTAYRVRYSVGKSGQTKKLAEGASVEVVEGMVFDVDATVES